MCVLILWILRVELHAEYNQIRKNPVSNFLYPARGILHRIQPLHKNLVIGNRKNVLLTAHLFAEGVREMATSKQTRHRRREANAYEKLRPTNTDWRNLESKSLVEICGTHRSNCGELYKNAPLMFYSKCSKSFQQHVSWS